MKKIFHILTLVIFAVSFSAQVTVAETYKIDNAHSSIDFSVSHLTVSETKGTFGDFLGVITFDPGNLGASSVNVTIQAASIDTRVEARDSHLRNSDFFDVESHPTLDFKSNSIEKNGDGYLLVGDLTIRGVTKRVSIPAKIFGPVQSPFGSTVIGLAGEITINRQDFGVSWNKTMDTGGLVVGNDVEISFNVEAHKK